MKVKPPHFYRRANWLYTTSDGEYSAANKDGSWVIHNRAGEVLATGKNYPEAHAIFREWWNTHGTDKREKPWGRFE